MNDKIDQNTNFAELPSAKWLSNLEKLILNLYQFLRYITWFNSQDLPFNGENVCPRNNLNDFSYFLKILVEDEFPGVSGVTTAREAMKRMPEEDRAKVRFRLLIIPIEKIFDVFPFKKLVFWNIWLFVF